MSVHDIPGYAQILSGFADRTTLEFGVHRHGGVRYVPALLDNDLLRIVYVEPVHDELLAENGFYATLWNAQFAN